MADTFLRLDRFSRALCALAVASLILLPISSSIAAPPLRGELTFPIPPQSASLKIGNQKLEIVASGLVTIGTERGGGYFLRLGLNADLADFQRHLTELLGAQLNKNDPCGDRIAIERTQLVPEDPSVLAIVQLHYERYACGKIFGKRRSTRLVSGTGTIQLRLTPSVINGTTLKLTPEVVSIQADGTLGTLLRAGNVEATVRKKVNQAMLSAMQKGQERALTLPPEVQNIARIDEIRFADEGSGNLGLLISGEVHITRDQVRTVEDQLQKRILHK